MFLNIFFYTNLKYKLFLTLRTGYFDDNKELNISVKLLHQIYLYIYKSRIMKRSYSCLIILYVLVYLFFLMESLWNIIKYWRQTRIFLDYRCKTGNIFTFFISPSTYPGDRPSSYIWDCAGSCIPNNWSYWSLYRALPITVSISVNSPFHLPEILRSLP